MSRQTAIAIDNDFSKGLNTSASPIKFPPGACSQINNCVLDISENTVDRRQGINIENTGVDYTITSNKGAFSEFIWRNAGGSSGTSFLVVQQCDTLHFYDISNSTDVSINKLPFTINLLSYLSFAQNPDPALYACQFTCGNGLLFVTNPSINPLMVLFDPVANSLSTTAITIKVRDFYGLPEDSGLTFATRPTSSLPGLSAAYPHHYYNLMNQGWGETDALSLWDTARTDMPNDYDFVGLYRSSPTVSFSNSLVTSQSPMTVKAPRGHFILNAFNFDRVGALTNEGFSAISLSGGTFALSGTVVQSTATFYGYHLASAANIISCTYAGNIPNSGSTFTATLYGKNSAPVTGTDGTSLGTFSSTSTFINNFTINSSDTTTTYSYYWVQWTKSGGPAVLTGSNFNFWSGSTSVTPNSQTIITNARPSTCAFYAGRVFWGGADGQWVGNNIYFSQVAQTTDQYSLCYQIADPTSEINPDLVASDGGVISIPEMASLKRLYVHQNALIAFASNGIWLIQGSAGQGFAANDYVIKRISSVGTFAPLSIVNYKGIYPIWWAEDGIYMIEYDPRFESYTVVPESIGTIFSFYKDIPLDNRQYVKGTYDPVYQTVYWIYSSQGGSVPFTYDSCLALNGFLNAFYPWTFSSDPGFRVINGLVYVQDADHTLDPKPAFIVSTMSTLNIADMSETHNYLDWGSMSYVSSFTTNYKLDGQTQKLFQPGYVYIFVDNAVGSSVYCQAIYDYAIDTATGKFSNFQQCYPTDTAGRRVNYRRLKVRGIGRALQLHFMSDGNSPFRIYGWSFDESINATD